MTNAHLRCGAALLVGISFVARSGIAAADREIGIGIAYDARAPIGSFRRAIPETSFGGFQARWDYYPLAALATGIEVQYNLFQRPSTTDTVAIVDGAITGTTFRYASFWSAMPTARYYLFPQGDLRPYAELGVGVVGVTTVLLVSDQPQRNVTNALIVQPSAGFLWRVWQPSKPGNSREDEAMLASAGPMRKPMESLFGLTASVTYAYTTADVIGSSNVSYAGIQVGIYAKP